MIRKNLLTCACAQNAKKPIIKLLCSFNLKRYLTCITCSIIYCCPDIEQENIRLQYAIIYILQIKPDGLMTEMYEEIPEGTPHNSSCVIQHLLIKL